MVASLIIWVMVTALAVQGSSTVRSSGALSSAPAPSALSPSALLASVSAPAPRVLRVGSWNGVAGDFSTIVDAVHAAQPGDWILVGPGDYHEQADHAPGAPEGGGAVTITTPGIRLRGMDRNAVVVDGTKPGSAQCDSALASQDLGALGSDNQPVGRNGIVVSKADGVSIDNLTACNFLRAASGGNQIWFNGGDGSGQVGLNSYSGSYLTATSTSFSGNDQPHAEYGIFVSNARGPGVIAHTYASNQADASYYVGACPDCNAVLDDAHAQHSALGYSGTNSGGHLIVQNSEWDDNKVGIVTNSQNNDDAPSPQDGSCPNGGTGPTGSSSCTVFRNNRIHGNNNPNVPSSGSANLGPVGTGLVIAGGRHDTVVNNQIYDQGAWGVITVPFPDDDTPPPVAHCEGGTPNFIVKCYYDDYGNEIAANVFSRVGTFGNESNGDLADLSGQNTPGNCWHGNLDEPLGPGSDIVGPASESPANLQATHATCGAPNAGADLSSPLAAQLICATQAFGPCADQPGHHYPRATQVTLRPLTSQPTMPHPCTGVPTNPWCPAVIPLPGTQPPVTQPPVSRPPVSPPPVSPPPVTPPPVSPPPVTQPNEPVPPSAPMPAPVAPAEAVTAAPRFTG